MLCGLHVPWRTQSTLQGIGFLPKESRPLPWPGCQGSDDRQDLYQSRALLFSQKRLLRQPDGSRRNQWDWKALYASLLELIGPASATKQRSFQL